MDNLPGYLIFVILNLFQNSFEDAEMTLKPVQGDMIQHDRRLKNEVSPRLIVLSYLFRVGSDIKQKVDA